MEWCRVPEPGCHGRGNALAGGCHSRCTVLLAQVGSVMSLVSSGEVRYQGILNHVDMANSRITLVNGEELAPEPWPWPGRSGKWSQ